MFQKVSQKVSINLSSDSIDFHLQVLSDKRLSYADKCLYNYFFLQTLRNGKIVNVSVNQVINELRISFPQYYKSRRVLVKCDYIECLDKEDNILAGVCSNRICLSSVSFDSELTEDQSNEYDDQDDYESDDYDQDDDQQDDIIEPVKPLPKLNSEKENDIILSSFLYDDVDRNTGHIEKITLSQFNKLSPKKRETFLRSIMDQDLIAKLGLLDEFYAIDRSKPALIYNLINDNEQDIDSIPF